MFGVVSLTGVQASPNVMVKGDSSRLAWAHPRLTRGYCMYILRSPRATQPWYTSLVYYYMIEATYVFSLAVGRMRSAWCVRAASSVPNCHRKAG